MNATRKAELTRDVITRLEKDGWRPRGGKGDHVNYTKPGERQLITTTPGGAKSASGYCAAFIASPAGSGEIAKEQ